MKFSLSLLLPFLICLTGCDTSQILEQIADDDPPPIPPGKGFD